MAIKKEYFEEGIFLGVRDEARNNRFFAFILNVKYSLYKTFVYQDLSETYRKCIYHIKRDIVSTYLLPIFLTLSIEVNDSEELNNWRIQSKAVLATKFSCKYNVFSLNQKRNPISWDKGLIQRENISQTEDILEEASFERTKSCGRCKDPA